MTIHGRAREKSVAARIAYVAGTRVKDDYTQTFHDNRGKLGVLRVGVFGFESSFQGLASAIDAAERRRDSNTCREVVIGLPCLLSEQTRYEILTEIALAIHRRWGVAGVAALHAPSKKGDQRNDHGHLIFSTRAYANGVFGKKTRQLDILPQGRAEVAWLREVVSLVICRILRSVGRGDECLRWDHRSYAARGISKRPGKHDGPVRRRMKRERKLAMAAKVVGDLTRGEKRILEEWERKGDRPKPTTYNQPNVAALGRPEPDSYSSDLERRIKMIPQKIDAKDSKPTRPSDSQINEMDFEKLERLTRELPDKIPERSRSDFEVFD